MVVTVPCAHGIFTRESTFVKHANSPHSSYLYRLGLIYERERNFLIRMKEVEWTLDQPASRNCTAEDCHCIGSGYRFHYKMKPSRCREKTAVEVGGSVKELQQLLVAIQKYKNKHRDYCVKSDYLFTNYFFVSESI